MSKTPATDWYQDDHDDYGEHVECYECGGEGGRASCMSDCCPFEGGEEMCDEPACWRRCDICDGKGGWVRDDPQPTDIKAAAAEQNTAGDSSSPSRDRQKT